MRFHWPTLLFQAINFLVLLAVLWRLLWRPLRRHMQARQARIDAGLAAVELERKQLETAQAEAQAALTRAKAAEAEALQRAEREAEARRAELLERARQDATAEWERMRAQLRAEQRKLEEDFLAALPPLLARLLGKLLSELGPGADLHAAACQRLAEHLDRLDAETKAALRRVEASRAELELAEDAVPEPLQSAVRRLLPGGEAPRRVLRPELLAGARLRMGDRVFDGSLEAQIGRLLGDGA